MPSCNFVCRPAGAHPARPRVRPPEPVVSLAPVVETRQAMRRQTNVRAVGPRPRNLGLSGCREGWIPAKATTLPYDRRAKRGTYPAGCSPRARTQRMAP